MQLGITAMKALMDAPQFSLADDIEAAQKIPSPTLYLEDKSKKHAGIAALKQNAQKTPMVKQSEHPADVPTEAVSSAPASAASTAVVEVKKDLRPDDSDEKFEAPPADLQKNVKTNDKLFS